MQAMAHDKLDALPTSIIFCIQKRNVCLLHAQILTVLSPERCNLLRSLSLQPVLDAGMERTLA